MIKVGLVTTLGTNIGDDFIREGICETVRGVLGNKDVVFTSVNKHKPFTVYAEVHPLRKLERWLERWPVPSKMRDKIQVKTSTVLHKWGRSRFDDCQAIIQCGTPVAWPGCSLCEWAVPLWHQVIGRLSRARRTPILNLGAGSCYPWEHQPGSILGHKDRAYLEAVLSYCRVTTVRDRLAEQLFLDLGVSCAVVPCPALLTAQLYSRPANQNESGWLLINYMDGGGHYDWGQNIDRGNWRRTIMELVERMERYHKIAFICHDEKELRLAADIAPHHPRMMPTKLLEYFQFVRGAKVAVCNRLHSAVALAGLGIPSLAVGTDSRLLMTEALGLPYVYVKEASPALIEEKISAMLSARRAISEDLLVRRDRTMAMYQAIVGEALGCAGLV